MIILAIKTVPPCVLTAASIPSLVQAQAIPSLRNSWKPCTVTGLKSKEQACLVFINVDQAKCSTSGTSPCKNQRLKRICGRGGIGRLGGFRFLCESVQVRVLSPAPKKEGAKAPSFLVRTVDSKRAALPQARQQRVRWTRC